MWVKIAKKAALTVAMVILSISVVWAAPSESSSLIKGKSDAESSLERDIGGGVTVTCEGISLKDGIVYVEYAVLSEEDVVVKVSEASALFDGRGGRLDVSRDSSYISIGEEETSEREVIAEVKTAVTIKYPVGTKYELTDTYARASVTINGQKLVFRGIPSKK
jgi:hypothetical protein